MGLIWGILENQRSAGATATTLSTIVNASFPVQNMHIDVYSLKNATTASSLLVEVQKLQEVHLNTTAGTPESSIRGQDLFDFHPTALGRSSYISVLTAVDNDPHMFATSYPFSPFPDDPTENFGLPANRATTFEMQFIADTAASFDTYTYDLTLEGVDAGTRPNPKGYIKFVRDEQTLAVGSAVFTRFVAKRLLGIFNFVTTSFDDLAAAAAIDVTTIRTQEIAFSRNTVYGPFRPARAAAFQWLPMITASPPILLDNGDHFENFGINNRMGDLGLDVSKETLTEIKTTGGAANAARIYPVCLVQ